MSNKSDGLAALEAEAKRTKKWPKDWEQKLQDEAEEDAKQTAKITQGMTDIYILWTYVFGGFVPSEITTSRDLADAWVHRIQRRRSPSVVTIGRTENPYQRANYLGADDRAKEILGIE